MAPALLLADHESLYEFSRMSRAVMVGAALAALSVYVYRRVRPATGRPWASIAGRFALAALAVAALTIGLGLVPRETSGGSIICGPALNVPQSVPAFTTAGIGWADSASCNDLMDGPMWWLTLGILGSTALFVAAGLTRSRRPARSP